MRLRHLGLSVALLLALMPAPAAAQGDFLKEKIKDLIAKSGVYVSTTSRSSIDGDVTMGRSFGIGYGSAGSKSTGWKYPFSLSSYRGDLENNAGAAFGQFKAQQLMSGIGYQWLRGKMVYSAELGVGYSFNKVTLNTTAASVFNTPDAPVQVSVSNSFVIRPKVKAEYFVHHKLSIRTQLGYTYTEPDVVVQTATDRYAREWRPHHMQFNIGVGFFPFRKAQISKNE